MSLDDNIAWTEFSEDEISLDEVSLDEDGWSGCVDKVLLLKLV